MNPEHTELWRRLEEFRLDQPGAMFPFSRKLAREQGWSPAFALRVVAEYKRFLFLFAASGHPVSPSDAVDQAWHLHLTYTQSYWDELCGGILGRPLHHVPSQGGPGESAKFAAWYERTLGSYRRFFGEAPPADIWPPATGKKPRYRRVDLARFWIVPRPRQLSWATGIGTAALGLVAVAGCHDRPLLPGSIFDLRGPAFLQLYLVLFGGALAAGLLLRWRLRGPGGPEGLIPADPYLCAWLAGGAKRATLTAISSLAAGKAVAVTKSGATEIAGELPAGAHPLEAALYEDARRGVATIKGLTAQTEIHGAPLAAELESLGLALSPGVGRKARWRPFWVALIPVGLGLIKIAVGLSRDKPVGFLVVFCLLSIPAVYLLLGRRVWRSRRGDRMLARLRQEHGHLERPIFAQGAYEQLPWAVALFGLGVLSGSPISYLERALLPPPAAGGDSGSGGSACGGGDGGGGCGGGCGGCGGGD